MTRFSFQEPQTPAWQQWRQEVAAELAALQAQGPPYTIKRSLYTSQREQIFTCYANKCAYCECFYKISNNEGDVEHFRPKGRVRDLDRQIVKIVVGGKKQNHPGYWWLAYEPINLLPSCALCNRSGKGDYFPLEPGGVYALNPGDEASEHPLLIHPGLENPDDHLRFDPQLGVLIPLTARGEQTIATFLLNRDHLLQARLQTYRHVAMSIHQACKLTPDFGVDTAATLMELNQHKRGAAQFSLAGRKALDDFAGPVQQLIARLQNLLGQ